MLCQAVYLAPEKFVRTFTFDSLSRRKPFLALGKPL